MLSLYLKNGYSFPKSRAKALTDYCLENNILQFDELDNLLNKPNNILAIEYLKAIKRLNSSIKPVAIKRVGAGYNSKKTNTTFASATGIRNEIASGNSIESLIPSNCNNLYGNNYLELNDFSQILAYKLLTEEDFTVYYDINEDLSNRINNLKYNFCNVEEFIKEELPDFKFKTPDGTYLAWIDARDVPYTAEEIQDALVNVGGIGIMKGEIYGGPKYLRMNIGCPQSKLKEGLRRFKIAMDALYSK